MRRQTTKELIVGTFFELALTKPVSSITVSEICRTADISRPTFYKYFVDKDELASWAGIEAGRDMLSRLGPDYTWRDYLREVCQGNRAAGDVLRNLTHNTKGYRGFAQTMYRNQLALVSAHITRLDPTALTPRTTLVLRVYLHGIADRSARRRATLTRAALLPLMMMRIAVVAASQESARFA